MKSIVAVPNNQTKNISSVRSNRKIAILVGLLFLSSTATFAIGSSLIDSYFSGQSAATLLLVGVFLQAYTGVAVVGIGILMLPLLTPHQPSLARAYVALRILECLAIFAIGALMLTTKQQIQHDDIFIYLFTAIGGIVFSYLLYVSELIPRALAGLGMAGYMVLLLGIPISFLGLADLNNGWGMVFFVPGGLFEFVLPILLFVVGFRTTTVNTSSASSKEQI